MTSEISHPLAPNSQSEKINMPTERIPKVPDDRLVIATLAMQGMLAHPTRYKPRQQDDGLTWHQAIAREALEIADALIEAHEEANAILPNAEREG